MSVDITDRDELKAWLEKQPREVVVSIAVRSALRMLPLSARIEFSEKSTSKVILPLFRAVALSWTVYSSGAFKENRLDQLAFEAFFPNYKVIANNASQAVLAAIDGVNNVASFAPAAAAHASIYAANSAILSPRDKFSEIALASSAIHSVNYASAYMSTDLLLSFDVNNRITLTTPLWQTLADDKLSEEIAKLWRELKTNLLSLNPNWHVWTDWYEARLYPDKFPAPNKKLELARAMIPEEIWDQGWEVVNPYIEKLIEEHGKEEPNLEMPIVDESSSSIARDMSGRSAVFCTPMACCENTFLLSVTLPWSGSNAVPNPLSAIENFSGDMFEVERCKPTDDLLAFLVDGAIEGMDKNALYAELVTALDSEQTAVYFGSINPFTKATLDTVSADRLKGLARLDKEYFRVGLFRVGVSIVVLGLVSSVTITSGKAIYDIGGAIVEHITNEMKKPAVVQQNLEVQRQEDGTAKSLGKQKSDGTDFLDT